MKTKHANVKHETNLFDKIQVEVQGGLFKNVFIKFIDAKVELCLSEEEARMFGQTLLMRADHIKMQREGLGAGLAR